MTTLDSLQDTLAAEHAALHLYGVFGGRTSQSAEPSLFEAVTTGFTTHRTRRDELELAVRDLGAEPVAAAATYALPGPLTAPRQVAGAALQVERACAESYAALVANTVDDQRRWAVDALTACALLQLRLGGRPEAFPGAPELG
jgi:hypothetical protein